MLYHLGGFCTNHDNNVPLMGTMYDMVASASGQQKLDVDSFALGCCMQVAPDGLY